LIFINEKIFIEFEKHHLHFKFYDFDNNL